MTSDMYVILEWNQASHRPKVADDRVYDSADDAEEIAATYRRNTRLLDRRETYTVHSLNDSEDDE